MKIIHYKTNWSFDDKKIVCQTFKNYQNFFVSTIQELVKLQLKWSIQYQNCCQQCYIVASYEETTPQIINNCSLNVSKIIGSVSNSSFYSSFPKFKYGISQINNSVNIQNIMEKITNHDLFLYNINNLNSSVYENDLFGVITNLSLNNSLPVVQNSNVIVSNKYFFLSSFNPIPTTLYNEYCIVDEVALNQLLIMDGYDAFVYEIKTDNFIVVTSPNYQVTVYINTLNLLGYEIDLNIPSGPLIRNEIQSLANLIYRAL